MILLMKIILVSPLSARVTGCHLHILMTRCMALTCLDDGLMMMMMVQVLEAARLQIAQTFTEMVKHGSASYERTRMQL
jgi:hypothetical protein